MIYFKPNVFRIRQNLCQLMLITTINQRPYSMTVQSDRKAPKTQRIEREFLKNLHKISISNCVEFVFLRNIQANQFTLLVLDILRGSAPQCTVGQAIPSRCGLIEKKKVNKKSQIDKFFGTICVFGKTYLSQQQQQQQ